MGDKIKPIKHMFTVDRKSAESKSFDKPGTYSVEITSVEPSLTPKGDSIVKLVFRGADGSVASDNILNRDTTWWRVNQLLAACPSVQIADGQQLDFAKREVFNDFLAKFKGATLDIKLEEETYVKDGESKKTLRVRRYIKSPVAPF